MKKTITVLFVLLLTILALTYLLLSKTFLIILERLDVVSEEITILLEELGIIPAEKPPIEPERLPREIETINISNLLQQEKIVIHGYNIQPSFDGKYLKLDVFKEDHIFHQKYVIKDLPKTRYFTVVDSDGNVTYFYINDDLSITEELMSEKYGRYIIELKEDPILVKKTELEKEIKEKEVELVKKVVSSQELSDLESEISYLKNNFQTEIERHEKEVEFSHKIAKNDINGFFDEIGLENPKIKEYKKIFNGLSVKAPKEVYNKMIELPYVKKVYPDVEVKTFLMDSVPLINANDLWTLGYTGKGIKIAIVDTGVDYTHPDLGGCLGEGCKVIGGYDFVYDDEDPMDDHGHGTHCAGIAAGNGTLKGVAPDAKILAYKVLNFAGGGYESDVIAGIEQAVNDSADIISMSLGMSYYAFEKCYDVALSKVVENAVDSGVIVVVAAGNSYYYKTIAAPGCAEKVITVGATDKNDTIAYFSSKGPVIEVLDSYVKPDVVAPGVNICSSQYDGAWNTYKCYDDRHVAISGTSMATPHVAGLVALLKQEHSEWNPEQIKSAIMGGAIDLNKDAASQGAGRIDALKSHDTSILISPPSIGVGVGDLVDIWANKTLKIKNLRTHEITVTLNSSLGEDGYGNYHDVGFFNESSVVIPSNETFDVVFSINMLNVSDAGGLIYGKVELETEGNKYIVPYGVSSLSYLNISVVGFNLDLYPDLCLHSDDMYYYKFVSQNKITGNNYIFGSVPNKNYTVYALGDGENYSLSYILMGRVYVPMTGTNITLNLSEARPFVIIGEGVDGSEIDMYEFEMGFTTYKGLELRPFGEIIKYNNIFKGNRTVYLSNKPESDFDIDIVFKYSGIPVKE